MTDINDNKFHTYLSGQAVGTLLACGLIWAVLSLCGVGAKKADKESPAPAKKESVRPAPRGADAVRVMRLDSLQRSR